MDDKANKPNATTGVIEMMQAAAAAQRISYQIMAVALSVARGVPPEPEFVKTTANRIENDLKDIHSFVEFMRLLG